MGWDCRQSSGVQSRCGRGGSRYGKGGEKEVVAREPAERAHLWQRHAHRGLLMRGELHNTGRDPNSGWEERLLG